MMHKEKYEDLLLRFAKELHEIGVTENIKKITAAQFERAPNVASCGTAETVKKFHYRYDGYAIEAEQIIKLTLKKCT